MINDPTLDGEIERVLAALTATPARIAAACEGIDDVALNIPPDENEWSANEILAHLRACADVWGKSIQSMLERDHPTLRYVSPRSRMKKHPYSEQTFRPALQSFSEARKELLRTLSGLDANGWCRGATFTGTTQGREQTVLSYAQRIAQHEEVHCAQMEALLEG